MTSRNTLRWASILAILMMLAAAGSARAEIKKLYVVFATHLDIGYTHTPDRVEMISKQNIDRVIELCRKNPDLRYTIEEAWLLREWLRRTDDPNLVKEMTDLIRQGRIEPCGVFASMHSNALAAEDANQIIYEGRRLKDQLGIPPLVTAMQNDVPGYDWCYPQILAKSGLRYMVTGLNTFIGGGPPTSDRLFYWEGIDGSRVLLFPQTFYGGEQTWAAPWLATTGKDEEADAKILHDLLAQIEKEGYPYESFLLQDNQSDNRGPDRAMEAVEKIRRWNSAGRKPYIQIATPRQFFEDVEGKYADKIPTRRGQWGANWDQIKSRGPMATTAYRRVQGRLPSAEKLLSLNSILMGDLYPRSDVADCWNGALLYGEHTAPEGLGAGGRMTRRELFWANQIHFNDANDAYNKTESLLLNAQPRMGGWTKNTTDSLIVFNPTSWERTDVVYAPLNFGRSGITTTRTVTGVRDIATSAILPADVIGMSELGGDACGQDSWESISFVARNVPPMGYRAYRLQRGNAPNTPETAKSNILSIENSRFRVDIEAANGAIVSILDKKLGKDLVRGDANSPKTLFNYPSSATPADPAKVETRLVEGKTFQRLEIRRPGTWFPETDIRLAEDIDHVEIRNVYDRQAWKQSHPQDWNFSANLQMPLNIPVKDSQLYVSGPNGYRRIPDDLFPNSIRDCWPSSAFVALSDGKFTILVSSPADFLFFPAAPWEPSTTATLPFFPLATQAVAESFNASMRSGEAILPFTEPRMDDRIVRRYAVSAHAGGFDAQTAQRFGWGYRQDMLAQATPGGSSRRWRQSTPGEAKLAQPSMSFVSASDADVWVVALRRSLFPAQDFYILRLQETAGHAKRKMQVQFAPELGLRWAAQSDMVERKGSRIEVRNNTLSLQVGPFETQTLALGFAKKSKD